MRLIDADALIEAHYNAYNEDQNKSFSTWSLQLIRSAPTIDAVEVVRCKDCKYYIEDGLYPMGVCKKMSHHTKWDNKMNDYVVLTENDFFCSYGERKEGTD